MHFSARYQKVNMVQTVPFFLTCFSFVIITVIAVEDESNALPRAVNAKGMLSSLTENLLSRGFGTSAAGGSSQVISLNITNLLVLVLLKALIFAAGSIGAGTWKGGFGRSLDGEETILTEDEILLFLSYLTGTPGNNGCLQHIACLQPEKAQKYSIAAEMLLKTSKILSIDPDMNYYYVVKELKEAAKLGLNGGDCNVFACGKQK